MKTSDNQKPYPGDILIFTRPHRLVDYAIKLFTMSRYYHVAIYVEEDRVIEARPKGVIIDSIGDRAGGFAVLRAPENLGEEALSWAKTQLGAPFDHMDFVVIMLEHLFLRLHLNKVPSGKYSCAEFVATAFDHAGVRLFPDRDLDDIEPRDFAELLPVEAVSST